MGALSDYRYNIEMKYINVKKGTFRRIRGIHINWVMIDRDYDQYNMPIVYASIKVDSKVADDMILNYKSNLINLTITKYQYDPDAEIWVPGMGISEPYLDGQFEYFTDEKPDDNAVVNELGELVLPEGDGEEDHWRQITIGLMKLKLINNNKIRFNMTLLNTNMTDALMTVTKDLTDLVMEPLVYDDILPQIIIPPVDSVSKIIDALNTIKVFYPTKYRFFMDFDYSYLLSSNGTTVLREGQTISDLLISVKEVNDVKGMQEGCYINNTQKNYQVNVSVSSVGIQENQAADKSATDVVAVNTSGEKQEESLNVDKADPTDVKYTSVTIPNDNLNMVKNIVAETESNNVQVSVVMEHIDSSIIDINGLTVIHHIDRDAKYNGQYLLGRKRELFINNEVDFTVMVVGNYRKLKPVETE